MELLLGFVVLHQVQDEADGDLVVVSQPRTVVLLLHLHRLQIERVHDRDLLLLHADGFLEGELKEETKQVRGHRRAQVRKTIQIDKNILLSFIF